MPPLVALGIAAGVAGGAATAYGANKASESADKAGVLSAAANDRAIQEQQRQDAERKQEFDQQQSQAKAQWDAEQSIRAPYRAAGRAALTKLSGMLGVDFDPGIIPAQQAFPGSPAPANAAPNAGAPVSPVGAPAAANPAVMPFRALMPQNNGALSPGAVQIKDAQGNLRTFASQAQADAWRQQTGTQP